MAPEGKNSLLLVISGPAGSGKTTLCERLTQTYPSVQRFITTTSRPPREGEADGVDYHFMSPQAFREKVEAGGFYEWAEIHGRFYGTEKSRVQEALNHDVDLLLNIDVQGAESFRQQAESDPYLAARLVTIFIKPKDLQQLRERLQGRGSDTPEEIDRRLDTALQELPQAARFDHVIESGDRETDFRTLQTLFEHEKKARARA